MNDEEQKQRLEKLEHMEHDAAAAGDAVAAGCLLPVVTSKGTHWVPISLSATMVSQATAMPETWSGQSVCSVIDNGALREDALAVGLSSAVHQTVALVERGNYGPVRVWRDNFVFRMRAPEDMDRKPEGWGFGLTVLIVAVMRKESGIIPRWGFVSRRNSLAIAWEETLETLPADVRILIEENRTFRLNDLSTEWQPWANHRAHEAARFFYVDPAHHERMFFSVRDAKEAVGVLLAFER